MAAKKKKKAKAKRVAKKQAKRPQRKPAKKKTKAKAKVKAKGKVKAKAKAKAKPRVAAKKKTAPSPKPVVAKMEHAAIALPGRKTHVELNGAYKGATLDHHPLSKREIDDVAREGLRGDGEILQVEEADFAPCRLVAHGEERFSLCFDDFRMPPLALFEERGLQGGGYTWEAVVSSLVKLRRPDLEADLSYDSESGMFVALGGRDSLLSVAKLIQHAIANESVLREAVDAADPDRLE